MISDFKDELLQEPKLLMIVTYDFNKLRSRRNGKNGKINQDAKAKGYKVIGMTNLY
jgi:hypothetical protein